MWEKHDKTMKSTNRQNVFSHYVLCTNTDLKRIENNGKKWLSESVFTGPQALKTHFTQGKIC
jgi:hypothetical protein